MRTKIMSKSAVSIAIAAAFGVTDSRAVDVPINLVSQITHSTGGYSAADLSTSTATWSYNTVTGVITGSGLFRSQFQINPTVGAQLYTHEIVDLTLRGDGAAGATSYECIEGTFGLSVGASLCGNYNFGANFTNESTTVYGPGTNVSQTIGGDDGDLGDPQDLSTYDGAGWLSTWNGTTLVFDNTIANVSGFTMTFSSAVPVPAALWLFGSALGLLGWLRRKR
jgi:hypothetical protein